MLAVILLLLLIWILWLTSKPGRTALTSDADRAKLNACLQEETVNGNHIDTYPDFHPMVRQLLDDIRNARQSVHVQFFKFEADAVGQCIGEALAHKAQEGVEVRLLFDDLSNIKSKWYYHRLRQQGVQVRGFGRAFIPFFRKVDNYRNHRKVVVIDGAIGYMGGMNIADRYYQGLSWGTWRDTQIRLQGPAVGQLQQAFLSDWCYATHEMLADRRFFPPLSPQGELPVRIITSGPIGDGPTIMQECCHLADQSQQYLYWESPYFIPTKEVMQALCRAARRGVDVRIIIPPRGDRGILTPLASQSYLQEAMDAGVHFYFYRKGYMHSKVMVCDDRWASVGSTNIDPRSYLLDLEINAFVEDARYAQAIKAIFSVDEQASTLVSPERWRKRPRLRKGLERLARLFSAQL